MKYKHKQNKCSVRARSESKAVGCVGEKAAAALFPSHAAQRCTQRLHTLTSHVMPPVKVHAIDSPRYIAVWEHD
eukprot:4897572-Amphidinium_carterae.1